MNPKSELSIDLVKRENFLNAGWQPYPIMPRHHNVRGRWDRLKQKFQVSPDWQVLLAPGDWISGVAEIDITNIDITNIKTQINEVVLLAPDFFATGQLQKENHRSGIHSVAESNALWQRHQEFQDFLGLVRQFFRALGFTEVQTPSLVECPGTEPTLDVFSTDFKLGKVNKKLFLPTSPELHLKKIVAEYGSDIFEIAKCYRNGEISSHHQPEFLMLEFYRVFADLEQICFDVKEFIFEMARLLKVNAPINIVHTTMQKLFLEKLNFTLTPQTKKSELLSLASDLNLHVNDSFSWDDLFYLLFLEKIEPFIPQDELTFLSGYPPTQAALARLTSQGWGDRVEVYWRGLELGNGFHELNDPNMQRVRFNEDLKTKKDLQKDAVPLDEDFLLALERGMPPTSGIAIGLERVFMALTGLQSLNEFRLFPRF